MVVIVMGVSGSGKTTIGTGLARELGWAFLDADDFHPAKNVAKMASGVPLTDDDRWPWLDRLNEELRNEELLNRDSAGKGVVLACSALKKAYRSRLAQGLAQARLVYLHGTIEFIRTRLGTREHKYMPASLLESQFATLEPPEDALEVDAALAIDDAVRLITTDLATKDRSRRP